MKIQFIENVELELFNIYDNFSSVFQEFKSGDIEECASLDYINENLVDIIFVDDNIAYAVNRNTFEVV